MASASPQLMPSRPSMRRVVLVVLLVAALALRLAGITAAPTEFHPMRQFRAAIIARNLYFQAVPTAADDWEREVAAASIVNEVPLEPPVIETLAAISYQVAGGEYLWLPRLFSVLFWLVGGYLLYRLAARLISEDAGLIAAAFFLLNPFTVLASRVIQPDPLMIMLQLAALNLMVWYDDQPSWRRLVIAAAVAAASPLVKPISIFSLFFAFAGLSLYRNRSWRTLISPQVIAFGAILAVPTLLWYLSGVVARTGMHDEVALDVRPTMIFERVFWGGWFTQISKVVGPLTFLAAIIGFALMKKDRTRLLVAGLAIGQVIMGLIFTYTIATHDYYQLQLVIIVGLCLPALLLPMFDRVRALFTSDVTRTAFVSLILVILAQFSAYENFWRTTFRYYYQNSDPAVAKYGPEIGEAVGHATNVIVLGEADGRPVTYYGQFTGVPWSYSLGGELGKAIGSQEGDVPSRIASIKASQGATYFVVSDLGLYATQPALRAFLDGQHVVASGPQYIIYDLTRAAP